MQVPSNVEYERATSVEHALLLLGRPETRVLAGGHSIVGFRNGDIVARLYPNPAADADEAHRRCARVSRLIAKLRGHGLVAKVPRARLYRPTAYGCRIMTAAIAVHDERFPDHYLAAA